MGILTPLDTVRLAVLTLLQVSDGIPAGGTDRRERKISRKCITMCLGQFNCQTLTPPLEFVCTGDTLMAANKCISTG